MIYRETVAMKKNEILAYMHSRVSKLEISIPMQIEILVYMNSGANKLENFLFDQNEILVYMKFRLSKLKFFPYMFKM